MTTYKIKCDNCDNDLTTTKNVMDYRLTLTAEVIPSESNIVTLLHINKPIPRQSMCLALAMKST